MLRIISPGIDILRKLIGGDMDYSLDEKKVGTYIDGKPVYSRTIVLDKLSSSGTLIDSNIQDLVLVHGWSTYSSGSKYHIPYCSSVNCRIEVGLDKTGYVFYHATDTWYKSVFHLFYTKIND